MKRRRIRFALAHRPLAFVAATPDNDAAFNAVAVAFLARHLGGRAEPLAEQLDDAGGLIPEGADLVPGPPAALVHRHGVKR